MNYSKGPWILKRLPDGSLFVEAPKINGMPYGLDVCGDDYTGYGDIEQRNANMLLICQAPALCETLKRIISELPTNRDWLDPDLEKFAKIILAKAEERTP